MTHRPPKLFRTIADDISDLWFAMKAQPYLSLTCIAIGFLFGMFAVIVPATIIAWAVL